MKIPSRFLVWRCMAWGVILAMALAVPAEAASQSGLKVKVLTQGNGGIYVGFTTQPAACSGNYKKTHGHLSKSRSGFTEYYALLIKKRALDQPVTITYEDAGNCTGSGNTLIITDVK